MPPLPDASAWQAFGGIIGVLVLLSAGLVALRRLGLVGRPPAARGPDSLEKRVAALEAEMRALREISVAREDWVPTISRVMGMLEQQGQILIRLDERIR